MSSWPCLECRTVYPDGIQACPNCSPEVDGVAKASAQNGSTHYVGEGDPVPGDVPAEVRLVGPGAPRREPKPKPVNVRTEGKPARRPVSVAGG